MSLVCFRCRQHDALHRKDVLSTMCQLPVSLTGIVIEKSCSTSNTKNYTYIIVVLGGHFINCKRDFTTATNNYE